MKSSAKFIPLLVLVLSNAFQAYAQAPKKIALVIGAQNYTSLPPLRNSLNDAKAISAALKQKGFLVQSIYDPKTSMVIKNGIQWYYDQIKGQVGAVGMIYYAGHGMQYKGDNYLIPTSIALKSSSDLEDCIKMNRILSILDETSSALHMLVLDACRTIPSFTRDAEQGLSKMSPPEGSIIVFATKAGKVASDGSGSNGLFTSKLLKVMNEPGLKVNDVFKKVQQEVYTASNKEQLPELDDLAIGGAFYFTAGEYSGSSQQKNEVITTAPVTDLEAGYTAGQLYSKGLESYSNKNYAEAFRLWTKSANQGNDDALCALGVLYENGQGVTRDYKQAFSYYNSVAFRIPPDKGNAQAQSNLGLMYEYGRGVAKNEDEAVNWYRKSADQRNVQGQENLKRLLSSLSARTASRITASSGFDYGYGIEDSPTVTIGSQVWFAKNLNVSKFANGDPIPEAKTVQEWWKAYEKKRPAWCYYENDERNGRKYGKLYNWYAVNDKRGLTPKGWHVSSDQEWDKLAESLGGEMAVGPVLKSSSGWEPNTYGENMNGTNSSGFEALPGGQRETTGVKSSYYYGAGEFIFGGKYSFWWSSSDYDESNAWSRSLSNIGSRDHKVKGCGYSVRCVKD